MGAKLAAKHDMVHFEASAVTNAGVDDFFSHIIDKCLDDRAEAAALA